MVVKASRDTTYALWTEGDDMFLGIWYTDEFDIDKPASEQFDKALLIDPVSPRSLLNLSLHFLNAGLSGLEMLFQRLQRPRKKEPALPDNGNNGKVARETTWGQQFKPNGEQPEDDGPPGPYFPHDDKDDEGAPSESE